MFAASRQLRELPHPFLLNSRMDDSIQPLQLILIVEDDRCKTAAIDAFVGAENRVAENGNNFVILGLPRFDHLMRHAVRFYHRKTELAQHPRYGGVPTRDSPAQAISQHPDSAH